MIAKLNMIMTIREIQEKVRCLSKELHSIEKDIENILNYTEEIETIATAVETARQEVEQVRDEVSESSRVLVPTRAAIDALLESGKPRLFEVAVDETLGNQELVPYRWNGSVLFMYDIYPSTTQPVI